MPPISKALKNLIPVAIRLESLGADPIAVLAEYMNGPDPDKRFAAAATLMQYLYPKKKPMELELKDIPDAELAKECERRMHLKILNGGQVG